MTQEEKLEEAKRLYKDANADQKYVLERLFPELKESEDERIRKEILDYIAKSTGCKRWVAWLEKQGDRQFVNYEQAEKEKYDFVSGQYIQCRKSFNEFKEDNSYWLEYIGDDTYVGRSDNILNQKFHITPRQLYRLFTAQHDYSEKDNNVTSEEEENAPSEYGKYVDECLTDASEHFFSEGEDKYSVADLFYAGVRCGITWFEKQGQTFTKRDVDDAYLKGVCDAKHELEKQGEQKPFDYENANIQQKDFAPKVEPKFKVGDIVRFKGNETLKGEAETHKIVGYDNELYVFADGTTDLFCEQDLYELVEQKPVDKVEPKFHEGDWITIKE